ncbi:MAG: acetolactate synthase small subunit [Clostridia bacterium]|nr:acetolactate synthase small subunit [Clostridia bacterium]
MDTKHVFSVLVENHSGVLARVASLFGRRGYNIDSLTVSATNDPDISRITLVVQGDEQVLEQLKLQTEKLEEIIEVFAIDRDQSLLRELLLVKVAADDHNRRIIREVAEIYEASIVDLSIDSMIIELTGIPSKIDAFLEIIGQHEIIEMCRTGVTALERGRKTKHGRK